MRLSLVCISLTLLTAGTLRAATQVRPGAQPLLRVHSEVLTALGLPPGPDFLLEQGDLFVGKGGLTNSVQILGGRGRFKTVLARSTSTPQGLKSLTSAIGASRIGVLDDCRIVNGIPGGGFHSFNWYGRGERTNQFTIHVTMEAIPGISNCSAETVALLGAVFQFTGSVLSQPDTEVIVSE